MNRKLCRVGGLLVVGLFALNPVSVRAGCVGCAAGSSYTITIPTGNSLVANHFDNTCGNDIYHVFCNTIAPPDDSGANPNNLLNDFTFTLFDPNKMMNVAGWVLDSAYYENDFTPNNLGF